MGGTGTFRYTTGSGEKARAEKDRRWGCCMWKVSIFSKVSRRSQGRESVAASFAAAATLELVKVLVTYVGREVKRERDTNASSIS